MTVQWNLIRDVLKNGSNESSKESAVAELERAQALVDNVVCLQAECRKGLMEQATTIAQLREQLKTKTIQLYEAQAEIDRLRKGYYDKNGTH